MDERGDIIDWVAWNAQWAKHCDRYPARARWVPVLIHPQPRLGNSRLPKHKTTAEQPTTIAHTKDDNENCSGNLGIFPLLQLLTR